MGVMNFKSLLVSLPKCIEINSESKPKLILVAWIQNLHIIYFGKVSCFEQIIIIGNWFLKKSSNYTPVCQAELNFPGHQSSTDLQSQMQLLSNTSSLSQILAPVASASASASMPAIANLACSQQHQYQCDTPPPIVTKNSTPAANGQPVQASAATTGVGSEDAPSENSRSTGKAELSI